jgi:hypothetical protein
MYELCARSGQGEARCANPFLVSVDGLSVLYDPQSRAAHLPATSAAPGDGENGMKQPAL